MNGGNKMIRKEFKNIFFGLKIMVEKSYTIIHKTT